jgi:hypothetical protein
MGAWKYQMISCSTLEINLVIPRTHVLFSIYPTVDLQWDIIVSHAALRNHEFE